MEPLTAILEKKPETRLQSLKNSDVISALHDLCTTEPGGQNFYRLGLACYKEELYILAAEAFQNALVYEPNNKEWNELCVMAIRNAHAEVNVTVPEVVYFDRETLLFKPVVAAGTLPASAHAAPSTGFGKRLRIIAGNVIGIIASAVMGGITKLWGTVAGYRDTVWTNWYRRPLFLGILTLAYMREKLNRNNLVSTYPKGVLDGFQEEGQEIPEGVQYSRTPDGSWNNLKNPKEGAAGTRFSRNVKLEAVKPETGERLLTPNPREISRHLLTRKENMKEVPFLNMLAAVWIQFQNHDWISHGENKLNEVIDVPMAADDPVAKKIQANKNVCPTYAARPYAAKNGRTCCRHFYQRSNALVGCLAGIWQ